MLDLIAKTRPATHKGPNNARHPVLARIVDLVDVNNLHYRRASAHVGHVDMISNMRRGRVPLFTAVDRLAGLVGHRLALEPLSGAPEASAASAWALRVNGEIVDVTLDEKKTAYWAGRGWEVVRLTEEGRP